MRRHEGRDERRSPIRESAREENLVDLRRLHGQHPIRCGVHPFTRGAEETVCTFRRMGLTPAIITGGFDLLAHPIADRLQIDHV